MKLLTDNNYNKNIMEKDITRPFIIFFESKSCPHCKTVKTILTRFEKDKEKPCDVDIYEVMSNDSPKLTKLYGLRSFPTTFFFCTDKNVKFTIIGAQGLDEFVKGYRKLCSGSADKDKKESTSWIKKIFGK